MKTTRWHAADNLANRGAGRRLLTCVVVSTCMALACSERRANGPDTETGPDGPREDTFPGLRVDLARIVGRESVERGDTLLRLFRERGFGPQIQEFPNTATDHEPRGVGRNLVVTVGEGRRDIVVGAHYDVVRLGGGGVTGGAVDNGAAAIVLTRYPSSDDRCFQAAGIPNLSLGMNETIASHQMWLVLNAGNQSGFRPAFVPDLFQIIHTGEDTIERVSGAAMTRLHEAIVALVLKLDRALRLARLRDVPGR